MKAIQIHHLTKWKLARFFVAGLMGLTTIFWLVGSAHATNAQSLAAVTCVPDDDNAENRYTASPASGKVTFQGTATGSLYFYCHFVSPEGNGNPDWNALFLTNKDTGSHSLVEAKLYRKQRSNGANYLVATLTSSTNANVKEDWKLLSTSLDFEQNAYWVSVRLYRSATTESPEFHSVTLGYLLY
jgi:hypothetical protein